MSDARSADSRQRELRSITTIINGREFVRRPGEPPSFEYVDAVQVTIPKDYWQEYLALHRRRWEIAKGLNRDLAGWWRDWEAFMAIMDGLGRSVSFARTEMPDGSVHVEEL